MQNFSFLPSLNYFLLEFSHNRPFFFRATGAGKTHTMIGETKARSGNMSMCEDDEEEEGILPRSIRHIFEETSRNVLIFDFVFLQFLYYDCFLLFSVFCFISNDFHFRGTLTLTASMPLSLKFTKIRFVTCWILPSERG